MNPKKRSIVITQKKTREGFQNSVPDRDFDPIEIRKGLRSHRNPRRGSDPIRNKPEDEEGQQKALKSPSSQQRSVK